MRWTLPNVITTGRLVLAPVLAYLLFQPSPADRILAFAVFVAAAVSDLWDGYLARHRGQVTNFGKLADPIADKLLLAGALIPFYVLTRGDPLLAGIPLFDRISLWVVLVLLGREVLVTGLRTVAARRGMIIVASQAGKYKAFVQNLFIGGMVLWMAIRTHAHEAGWAAADWAAWRAFHGWWVTVTLALALALTVYSMVDYLVSFFRTPETSAVG